MIVFVVFITILALVATFIDYSIDDCQKTQGFYKFLLGFSVLSNGKRLMTVRGPNKNGEKDPLDLLDGIRVMSIGWVVTGHTIDRYTNLAAIDNVNTIPDQLSDFNYVPVNGALYAVDTFFWLSGLLMAYFFIVEMEKEKTFKPGKIILAYIHRYLRITPTYLFVTLFFWSLESYLGSGPLWFHAEYFNFDCKDYWYTNFIYLNNFIPDYKGSFCMGVTWYLANDMQFFFISPIILLLYIKIKKYIGWASVAIISVVSVLVTALIAHHYNLNALISSADSYSDYYKYYYIKPYTRIPPYIFGIATGFIVYSYRKYRDSKEIYDKFALFIANSQEKLFTRIFTFGLGFSLINILIYSQYDTLQYPGSDGNYNH